MRAVVQRVTRASVTVEGVVVGAIERGLVVYLGVGKGDDERDRAYIVDKVVGLRVFEDEQGKMNRSVSDARGAVLVVSQFTLYGDVRSGKRPSFDDAMPPEDAERAYEAFVRAARERGITVATGVFRANMLVETAVDGPVTILLDSRKTF
ncbi:MAG: D-tyrosyl-tRNA(Tyr) deacylase [Myxococcales bacterium]|nr:D-tyrosyl-tRNA(Tyr) deacylase [Myxococcales bacterium]